MAKLYGSKTCQLEFLSDGFRQLLYSDEVRDVTYRTGKAIAADAGDGFAVDVVYGKSGGGTRGRVLVFVEAVTPEAREAEATDKVLTRAAHRRREV